MLLDLNRRLGVMFEDDNEPNEVIHKVKRGKGARSKAWCKVNSDW